MQTKTIGEILRLEREFHRLSIADLSKRTRIRQEYLRSLEENKFDELPSSVFVKGYIKTYGQIFGFDYQPLIAMLRRDYKQSARGKLVPREFIKPVLKRKKMWTPVTILVLCLFTVFLSFITYVGVAWYNLQKPPKLTIENPSENQLVSSNVIVKGKTLEDAIVSVNAAPVSLQVDGSFQTEIYLPREGINTITIEAKDRRGKSNIKQVTVKVEN